MKNSMQINGTLWVKKTSNREPLNGLPEGCWKAVPNGADWKEVLVIQRSAVHTTKWIFQRYRFNGSQWVAFNRIKDSLTMLVLDRKLSVMFEHGSLMLKREEATATPEPVPPVEAVAKKKKQPTVADLSNPTLTTVAEVVAAINRDADKVDEMSAVFTMNEEDGNPRSEMSATTILREAKNALEFYGPGGCIGEEVEDGNPEAIREMKQLQWFVRKWSGIFEKRKAVVATLKKCRTVAAVPTVPTEAVEPVPPVETTSKQPEAVVSGSEAVPVAAVEPTPEAVAELPPLLPTFRSRLQFRPETEEVPTVEAVAVVADCEFLEFHGCVHSSESSRLFERLLKPHGVSDYVATETHPIFNPESGQWETWSRSFSWFTYAGATRSNGERMTEEEKSEAVRKLRVEYGILAHIELYNPNRENMPGNATVVCVRVEAGVGLPNWFYRSFDLLGRGIPGDLQPVSVVR